MKKTGILLLVAAFLFTAGLFFSISNRQSLDPSAADTASDVIWISSSFFRKTDAAYIDLERGGNFFYKQEKAGISEVRTGEVSPDIVRKAFSVIENRSVLNAKKQGEGEPLFLQGEQIRIALSAKGSLKITAEGPLENFPLEIQNLWRDLKSLASKRAMDKTVKAVLSAGVIEDKQADFLKNDPRKFYEFLALTPSDFSNSYALKQAIAAPGRQIAVSKEDENKKLETYIRRSNLKSTGKDFFVSWDGKHYQLQLSEIN